ncbi:MAG: DUF4838 domain-containing protein, partial [Firmicutes bacterium]|nr:DUF4838 domain-containing protein [Bacillota bacterium]
VRPFLAFPRKLKRGLAIAAAALVLAGGPAWLLPGNLPLKEFTPMEETSPPAAVEKRSISGYKITVYGESEAEIAAGNLLAETLSRITGEAFTAQQGLPTGYDEILVGVFGGDRLGPEEYSITAHVRTSWAAGDRPDGDSIHITGGSPRAVLYGAYKFLEKYFDCRWYTSELAVIPQGPAEIAVTPLNEPERYNPPLEFREMDWRSRADPVYSVANGLNGNVYRSLDADMGGDFGYNGGMAHTIINTFLKPDEFFSPPEGAAHPDWYALRGKERVPKQLCLTNPEVLAEMIREVREQLEKGNGQPIVSVTQDDNGDYCQCEKCKAVDDEEGSHAGTMIRFVNAVAADIAADYPEALIDTFAYQYTRTPPKLVKPLPNVIVRLCSIECCFAHPLDDPGCPDNIKFARDIKAWSEICGRLYIWDYTTNYRCYNSPYPNFRVLQSNMRFFVRHNVKGVYEEGNYQSAECDSEFSQLRGYLLARLLFDPDVDLGAETDGFLKAYYGGGWQYMRAFLDLICDNSAKPGPFGRHRKLSIGHNPDDKALLDLKPNQVRYADKLWEKAVELAGDDACRQNVLRSQLSWRFWKACNRAGEFSRLQGPKKWQAANEQLYRDFAAFGVTRYSEGALLREDVNSWRGTPEDWRA